MAFTDAVVVVSPDRTVDRGTLVIREGRVVSVTAGDEVPAGAVEIDVNGKRIYPGFIDPYTEYGLQSVGPINPEKTDLAPRYGGDRTGARPWNEAIHAGREWIDSFAPDPETAGVWLDKGYTAVQSARFDGVFRGRGFVASLADGRANDLVLKARGARFASFDKGSSKQSYPSSLMGSIALIRQTLLDADWYRRARAAHELDPGQRPVEFNRGLEALADVSDPLIFETGNADSLLRAERIADEFDLSLIHVGSNHEYRRIEEIASLKTPMVLPLVFPGRPPVASFESELDVSLAQLRHWERAPHNPRVLEQAGVRFAFTAHGLDTAKQDLMKNVRKSIRRGLSPRTALAALTTVPAEIAGVADQVGTLEPGRRADFFISDGDPFAGPAELFSVWIDGRRVKRAHPIDSVDFRGTYELRLDGRRYELILSGKFAAPSGEIKRKEESVALAGLERTARGLRFYVPFDEPAPREAIRFELQAGPDGIVGIARRAGRDPIELSLHRKKDEQNDTPETADVVDDDPADLVPVSRTTHPDAPFGFETRPAPETVIVRNATVWTSGPEGVLRGADLLVEDGKITAVGRDLSGPRLARVIDGTGKHVTPGIIDEHSHLAIAGGVNEGSHAVTAEVRIGDVVRADDVGIYRALAGGVTTAQLLHGSANPIGGQAQVIKLRWGATTEDLKDAGAPPSIKFALGENVKQSNWGDHQTTRYPQSRMGVETIMRDAFTAARENAEARKRYEQLPRKDRARTVPPRRDLQMETLNEILNSQRFVHCHSYMQAEILMLMRLAEEFGFRIKTFTHILEGYKVADEMAAHGAGASTFADWWAYKFEVYDAIPYNTCLLAERGVVTSVNSDSGELIRRLNQEAAKSVMYCGTEEADALRMVTINPAIQLAIDDRTGSLEPGKDADFAIWTGNPLSIYSKVEQTWIDGVNYFYIERDLELRRADSAERRALIQKVLRTKDDSKSAAGGAKPKKQWRCEDVEDVWSR